MPRTLSKSDFKAARQCGTKLYYKELGYPSAKDEDPYLKLLAAGGYMVETIAKLLYPEGRTLSYDGGSAASAQLTRDAVAADQVTLFEATFVSNGKLARTDILKKDGTTFDLIEVKTKSCSLDAGPNPFRGKRGAISSDWRDYLEDVTFQVLVLRELYPAATIHPFLALVNKDKSVSEDLIHQKFRITRTQEPGRRFATTHVDFVGDVQKIRNDHFIAVVDVSREVDELLAEVSTAAARFVTTLNPLQKVASPLTVDCRDCEYRVEATVTPNGFRECWGDLADAKPHILDLCYVSQIGPKDNRLVDRLIQEKRCSLFDVPTDELIKKDGDVGARNERQLLQIRCTRDGTPWISDVLAAYTRAAVYPLHFIDFETSALAVPYHPGMHAYETVAFQWSCHTVAAPDAPPVHADWINTVDCIPSAEFARTLRECIGTAGTVFMWAQHERTVLRVVNRQLEKYNLVDAEVAAWIRDLAGTDKTNPGRLVDMNQLTLDGYFHPDMKGRTSIKAVLPAVWKADATVRQGFPEYERYDGGQLLDPYDALPPVEIVGQRVAVSEGTGAMLAYQEMLYGVSRDDVAARDNYRELLRQYCELDTAAMLMIWRHWCRLAAEQQVST